MNKNISSTEIEFIVPGAEISFFMLEIEKGKFKRQSYSPFPVLLPPQKQELIMKSFLIGQYPVTQDLFMAVTGRNPSLLKSEKRPVEQVSWFQAIAFCNGLSRLVGLKPYYYTNSACSDVLGEVNGGFDYAFNKFVEVYSDTNSNGFRLPSEAEWEYAARGGNGKKEDFKYCGGDKIRDVAWVAINSHGETKPVGLKLPNSLGLYDMSGNVWEWCEDKYHEKLDAAPLDGSAWVLDGSHLRIQRGGAFSSDIELANLSNRNYFIPVGISSTFGFRLAMSVER